MVCFFKKSAKFGLQQKNKIVATSKTCCVTTMKKTDDPILWFGMKLSPGEKQKIRDLARVKGLTQKDAVMRAVEDNLAAYSVTPRKGSLLERLQHLAGKADGPEDLATNPKHMEDFGR